MSRLLYNQAIVHKLQELIKKYPDLRFGQLLFTCEVLSKEYQISDSSWVVDSPFNEESKITWERMCNNKYCFNK